MVVVVVGLFCFVVGLVGCWLSDYMVGVLVLVEVFFVV